MNKLLAVLLLALSMNLYAGEVLDSEQTDYEFESEVCADMDTNACSRNSVYSSQSDLYPVQSIGFYTTGPSWYFGPRGLGFFPVPAINWGTVSGSYAPPLTK